MNKSKELDELTDRLLDKEHPEWHLEAAKKLYKIAELSSDEFGDEAGIRKRRNMIEPLCKAAGNPDEDPKVREFALNALNFLILWDLTSPKMAETAISVLAENKSKKLVVFSLGLFENLVNTEDSMSKSLFEAIKKLKEDKGELIENERRKKERIEVYIKIMNDPAKPLWERCNAIVWLGVIGDGSVLKPLTGVLSGPHITLDEIKVTEHEIEPPSKMFGSLILNYCAANALTELAGNGIVDNGVLVGFIKEWKEVDYTYENRALAGFLMQYQGLKESETHGFLWNRAEKVVEALLKKCDDLETRAWFIKAVAETENGDGKVILREMLESRKFEGLRDLIGKLGEEIESIRLPKGANAATRNAFGGGRKSNTGADQKTTARAAMKH